MSRLCDLGNDEFSKLLSISLQEAKQYLYSLEKKAHPCETGDDFRKLIPLNNEFKSTNAVLFETVSVPELFIKTMEHDYEKTFNFSGKKSRESTKGKDFTNMKQNVVSGKSAQQNRRAASKKKKSTVIAVVAVILVIALIVTVVMVANGKKKFDSSIITTYNIDEITYGNVSTTISASGSLTPITKETLSVSALLAELEEEEAEGEETEVQASDESQGGSDLGGMPNLGGETIPVVIDGKIGSVYVTVGDTVEAGEVLATVIFEPLSDGDEEVTRDIVAPYDAVLLEFYLHAGDEVTDETSVAMFMGTDGYTMTISVDENNISLIELGQEVEITIDVSEEDMPTGSVTDISYNGTASGSTTAYGIEITFDYVAGTYPGMSVSAEIVIEDSGDGLLVPVSAVYTSGNIKYVYLAPSGAAFGDEYEEGDLDVPKLTKVKVTEGMSDGTYIMIESDDLEEGDLIVITTITSTQTGSNSSGSGNGGMSGMPNFGGMSGGMPDFGGSMPDFGGGMPNFGGSGFPFG